MDGGGTCWKRSCSQELSGLFPEREGNPVALMQSTIPQHCVLRHLESACLSNATQVDLGLFFMLLGKQQNQQHTNAII